RGVAPDSPRDADASLVIEPVDANTAAIADDVVGRGFNEGKPGPPNLIDFGRVNFAIARSATYIARFDGVPAAGGRVSWMDVPRERGGGRVAILTGASTLPEFRGRGAQAALLEARLARARNVGCDTAFVTCFAGTPSERNIFRAGFLRAYDRDVFTLG
ncbi:MAG: GNAT family N-acetyltransferase, partial [Phycisphaerae bacterium]|nr:GNAT family N-acetyltransferase [Phycisphaerae bacterium]